MILEDRGTYSNMVNTSTIKVYNTVVRPHGNIQNPQLIETEEIKTFEEPLKKML